LFPVSRLPSSPEPPPFPYTTLFRSYTVSLLKAYYGEYATAENDFCFGHLPRITGDHSAYQAISEMLDGTVKGYFVMGENPAVGSDRKSTRLNSSHVKISYAVFCLKK